MTKLPEKLVDKRKKQIEINDKFTKLAMLESTYSEKLIKINEKLFLLKYGMSYLENHSNLISQKEKCVARLNSLRDERLKLIFNEDGVESEAL